ncbi:MAG: hypothetical protein JW882_10055 [Deltaproteobacteria bacterium]|nr:hypothetical protein [Deltaproteobacteria bacterium]
MPKKNRLKTDSLNSLMIYILGHKPYEFGLIPGEEGFVSYKELLTAIHEEPGWGHIGQGNINEVLFGKDRESFEAGEDSIRAVHRRWSFKNITYGDQSPPRILFTGVRRRAHPVVLEKGLRPIDGRYYALSPDRAMAERIGKRKDRKCVLLEVRACSARDAGIPILIFGDLFLAGEIPPEFISGPPVPKEIIKIKEEKTGEKQEPVPDFFGGTFILDLNRDRSLVRKEKGRKRRSWKEEARKSRRKGRI